MALNHILLWQIDIKWHKSNIPSCPMSGAKREMLWGIMSTHLFGWQRSHICASSSASSTLGQELWAQPRHTLQITHLLMDCEYKYPQYMQEQSLSLFSDELVFASLSFLCLLFLLFFSGFFFSGFFFSGLFLSVVLFFCGSLFISLRKQV
jgi:hypothetical protein